MTLDEMDAHPKNHIAGETKGPICDPCQVQTYLPVLDQRFLPLPPIQPPGHSGISDYCRMIAHNPAYCTRDNCACPCHQKTGMQLFVWPLASEAERLPNETGTAIGSDHNVTSAIDIARRERKEAQRREWGFGSRHRSDACWSDRGHPACKENWCICWCHDHETDAERIARTRPKLEPKKLEPKKRLGGMMATNQTARVGGLVGHVMWIQPDDDSTPYRAIQLPSGEIVSYEEHEHKLYD